MNIKNQIKLDDWFHDHRLCDVFSVKGTPPKGMRYNTGELVRNDVNVAWQCPMCSSQIEIEYSD